MYCKNCGSEMNENAAVCLNCGVKKGTGNSFCANCGQSVAAEAAVCLNCGAALKGGAGAGTSERSKLIAFLLALFLGTLGIHNFYLGYTKKAIIQLLCSLLLSWTVIVPIGIEIWALIEGIQALMGNLPDADGNALKD